jgi:hypothetical protein
MKIIITTLQFRTIPMNVHGVLFFFNEERQSLKLQDWHFDVWPGSGISAYSSILLYLFENNYTQKSDDTAILYLTSEGYFKLKLMLVDGYATISI